MQGKSVPRVSSAALAAFAFWSVYLVIALGFLTAYWSREPKLALTTLLVLPIWLVTGLVWEWRLSTQDEREVTVRLEKPRSYDREYERLGIMRELKKRRLVRRRTVVAVIGGFVAVIALALFAIAIWAPHGHPYSITAVLILGEMIPLAVSCVEE